MKKSYLTVVLTLTCLFGLGISARAQDASRVVATVPFEFVAGGETFPAGTYSIGRLSPAANPDLVIRSYDNSAAPISAALLPIVFDDTSAEQAKLGFVHVGDKYLLSRVETLVGVYTIGTPKAMTKVAQGNHPGTLSSSGTN